MGSTRKQQVVRPCVFCGRDVEMRRADFRAGPDAFAICREDNARLDAALATVTADVLAMIESGASVG